MNAKVKLSGLILFLLILSTLIFSSCSSSSTECSDEAVTDLVRQIIREQLAKTITYGPEDSKKVELDISAIRTMAINEKTGCRSCAAQLLIKGGKGSSKNPLGFTYTSELTDDEKIYVTVYGISPETLFMQ